MKYEKPEVVVLASAVAAIATVTGKGGDDFDGINRPLTATVSAYEVDE